MDHESGNLTPGFRAKVTVIYTPQIAGVLSYTKFRVKSHAGNELQIVCKGQAKGYDVELSSKTVSFGEV